MAGSSGIEPSPTQVIEPQHSGPLLRLQRLLHGRQGFTLVILEYSDSAYRDVLVRYLQSVFLAATSPGPEAGRPLGPRVGLVDAGQAKGDFATLLESLAEASRSQAVVHLVGAEAWSGGSSNLWRALNYQREQVAERCPKPLLLWVLRGHVGQLATEAPDFWAWRSGVFDVGSSAGEMTPVILGGRLNRSQVDGVERRRRIEEIDAYFQKTGEVKHPADLRLILERGHLLQDLGDWDRALDSFGIAVEGFAKIEDRHGEAQAKKALASLLADRGETAQALELLEKEVLPVFEQLHDIRSRAIVMGKIADIFQMRGDFDRALHIRQSEEVPVFQQIGDTRGYAVARSQIADMLAIRGDLDEALSIHQTELLPMFDQLGDFHSHAVTLGKVADILETRGDLDDSLRIRLQEELPAYKQLDDVFAQAITKAKIGRLLFQRGEEAEARQFFSEATAEADRLGIPEAEEFRKTLRQLESVGPTGQMA